MVELNFNPGDYVRFRLALKEIEGRVLESNDGSIVLIKLNSGYNIGIPKENILGFRVLKKYKLEERIRKSKLKEKKDCLQLVLLLQEEQLLQSLILRLEELNG